jgi:tRNA(adenine34) deaminase
MRIAIEEARQADFPYGAVIVRDGSIFARGRNRSRQLDDPTAHGEIDAIRRALAQHGSKALQGATPCTSGEPCAMCMGAILVVPFWSARIRCVDRSSRCLDEPDDDA